ncbi:hypothetical protein PENTCL1PPCAC_6920 [Pristionchus entomophagus]|uniref:Uncharacterized protein n=1 Tax=Pristionchus entomophagus TaxID=358040 RepID=A0AAV5SQ64_9BILA|nr:hypothetical protein PENTCL1PPCAC_6920 [Pristionchus entomophagus]
MAGSMGKEHRLALLQFGDSSLPHLNLDPILEYLECRNVLPEKRIKEIRSSFSPRLDLMKRLTKQGATAFDKFFLSLVHSQQVHLADSLRPFVATEVIASLENNGGEQRASGSNEEEMEMEMEIEEEGREGENGGNGGKEATCTYDGNSSLASLDLREIEKKIELYEKTRGEKIYQFTFPRGHALIISNEIFREMPPRRGTKADVNALHSLFSTKLGYDVQVQENLTGKDLMHKIKSFASSPDHAFRSSAVLCILTHGEHDVLYGVDDQVVNVHLLLSFFNSHNAPHLAGKPKIILLQACRGDKKDLGYDEMDSGRPLAFLNCFGGEGGMMTRNKRPVEADILVAYATPAHYVSWRNSEKGSWFIQSFVEVVDKKSHNSDLLSILTQVNAKVADSYKANSSTGEYKQISEFSSKLTKKFFFFPPS